MWKWGYERFTQDERFDDQEDRFRPKKLTYLEKNGLRVLDFAAANYYIIIHVGDRKGQENIVGMVNPSNDYNSGEYFG